MSYYKCSNEELQKAVSGIRMLNPVQKAKLKLEDVDPKLLAELASDMALWIFESIKYDNGHDHWDHGRAFCLALGLKDELDQ